MHKTQAKRHGFTLVELLVTIAIIGVIAGLLLPAIQSAREAARKVQCHNNLKNQMLGVLSFEETRRIIPPGRMQKDGTNFSWMFLILPYIEQQPLYQNFDLKQSWNSAFNNQHSLTAIPLYRCPSSIKDFKGDTDYTGINSTFVGWEPHLSFENRGTFVDFSQDSPAISLSSVTDGLSNTICISEAVDREPDDGLWANGINTLMHISGGVNSSWNGIYSFHPTGAMAAKLDGSCQFISASIDETTLGALLTRAGHELVNQEQ
jgi:prepilin-type N-terminal cleavage/methylation domain-containing protein